MKYARTVFFAAGVVVVTVRVTVVVTVTVSVEPQPAATMATTTTAGSARAIQHGRQSSHVIPYSFDASA